MMFLLICCFYFNIDLLANFGPQDGPKNHQKSVKKVIKNRLNFLSDFDSILRPFGIHVGSQDGHKINQKWHQQKSLKKTTKTVMRVSGSSPAASS